MGIIEVNYNVGGIKGLCTITPQKHFDSRGMFMETYNYYDMKEAGLDYAFLQDNMSLSVKGVIRGLHFQEKNPQMKLIRVNKGVIFDVVVDIREDSVTYGKWHGVVMDAEEGVQFLVPKGFAHGFLVLSNHAEVCYKCDVAYNCSDERGIAWNDPNIGIEWPEIVRNYYGSTDINDYIMKDGTPLKISEKDKNWPGLVAVLNGKEIVKTDSFDE